MAAMAAMAAGSAILGGIGSIFGSKKPRRPPKELGEMAHSQKNLADQLKGLVERGEITQQRAQAILGANIRTITGDIRDLENLYNEYENESRDYGTSAMGAADDVRGMVEQFRTMLAEGQDPTSMVSAYGNYLYGQGQMSEDTYTNYYQPMEKRYAAEVARAGSPQEIARQRKLIRDQMQVGAQQIVAQQQSLNRLQGGGAQARLTAADTAALAAHQANMENAIAQQERMYADQMVQRGMALGNSILDRAGRAYMTGTQTEADLASLQSNLAAQGAGVAAQRTHVLSGKGDNQARQLQHALHLNNMPYQQRVSTATQAGGAANSIYNSAAKAFMGNYSAQENYRQAKAAHRGAMFKAGTQILGGMVGLGSIGQGFSAGASPYPEHVINSPWGGT